MTDFHKNNTISRHCVLNIRAPFVQQCSLAVSLTDTNKDLRMYPRKPTAAYNIALEQKASQTSKANNLPTPPPLEI